MINRHNRTDIILVGYKPDNEGARKLYSKAGFTEAGLASWGEIIAKYQLKKQLKYLFHNEFL